MIRITEQAICPECGSNELEYWTMELESTSLSYPFTCLECGLKGHEVYGIEFSHMAKADGQMFEEETKE